MENDGKRYVGMIMQLTIYNIYTAGNDYNYSSCSLRFSPCTYKSTSIQNSEHTRNQEQLLKSQRLKQASRSQIFSRQYYLDYFIFFISVLFLFLLFKKKRKIFIGGSRSQWMYAQSWPYPILILLYSHLMLIHASSYMNIT